MIDVLLEFKSKMFLSYSLIHSTFFNQERSNRASGGY